MASRKKTRVIILFGGKSPEHEVSLQSAKNIYEAINKKKYEVEMIRIGKDGAWEKPIVDLSSAQMIGNADVVFPVLHGSFGEDGTVQGLLKLAGVPFVGASVLGSAIGMDKDVAKRLLRDAGISVAKFITITRNSKNDYANLAKYKYQELLEAFGAPFFVKPANLGSSVGVHKVRNEEQFLRALDDAFSYDTKVLAEEYIPGREIECSVLGNETPIASVPGEVIPQCEFYSYEAKYIDENGAILEIPAKLSEDVVKKVQNLAVRAFQVLCCEGMARADFFIKPNGEIYFNEINTIPGFTKISMYPKLWEATGISYPELIDRLIELAVERHERERKLKTSYT